MTDKAELSFHTNLSDALTQILLKRFQAKNSEAHLKDIIEVLMESLLCGETSIDLEKCTPPINSKGDGWPKEHLKVLLESGWINSKDAPILMEGSRISWSRWQYQTSEVITNLVNRSKIEENKSSKSDQAHLPLSKTLNSEQLKAVEAIETQKIILLSGGPGTGKTSTICEMISRALLIDSKLKIGLGAPTGKAARRLKEAIQESIHTTNQLNKFRLSRISCHTLHKWLEARDGKFYKNKSNPLELDLMIVDEMSMVDLSLMEGLLKALPINSQLILVGDPEQLTPVSIGAIWLELQKQDVRKKFKKGVIDLKKLYRNRGEIAFLANLIRTNGFDSFWERLPNISSTANVSIISSDKQKIPSAVINHLETHFAKLQVLSQGIRRFIIHKDNQIQLKASNSTTDHCEKLGKTLEDFIILCPRKNGKWGVNHLHKSFIGEKVNRGILHWDEGTPVICGENQHELGIANGDIGIVIGSNNSKRLLFRVNSEEGGLKYDLIHPARLKRIDPAFAITIHKSQGSESNLVFLLWPDNPQITSLANKEVSITDQYQKRLMYTAITRAKERLNLFIT